MSLTALIVDDEELARKNLSMLLMDFCPEIEVVGMAESKEEAQGLIEELNPDVLFLDIRMPSGSEGFELLQSIEKKNLLVVFVTAFKDFAVKAFNANAVYYLLKPIDIEELKEAVAKLLETHKVFQEDKSNFSTYFQSLKNLSENLVQNKVSNRIAISHTKGLKIVEDDSIIHLEASGNCTTIYFQDGTRYLDTRTLKVYENLLNPTKFFRTHKSHIVNLNTVKAYLNEDGHFAVLKSEKRIPVARNRVSTFVKTLKEV